MPIPHPPADPFASFQDQKGVRKFLVVLSYYNGDAQTAESLCDLIADMEPGPSSIADIMLYARNDTGPLSDWIIQKLRSKFRRVHLHRCRRLNAKGYPEGANEMWYDLVEFFRQPQWRQNYYAWLNLEADCVPMARNWISQLAHAYREATQEGKTILGHIHSHGASGIPLTHVNGSAIYGFNLFDEAGGLNLIGGPAQWAYDFYHAKELLPFAKDTPLIYMDYNRKTITAHDLWAIRKAGVSPVLVHGVKDMSAQQAVRAKFIDKDAEADLSQTTICTYFDPLDEMPRESEDECISAWRYAWTTAGWNAIVSSRFDAQKHPEYAAYRAKVETFGLVRVKGYNMSRFLRWLAFDYQGAGVHCDYDVLPKPGCDPGGFPRPEGFGVMQNRPKAIPSLVVADKEGMSRFIDAVLGFKHKQPVVTDSDIIGTILGTKKAKWLHASDLVREVDSKGWEKASVVHFSHVGCQRYSPGTPRGIVMKRWFESTFASSI